jgi:putative toxin-antitoxin system antitoxin component (TIGR02293 family)
MVMEDQKEYKVEESNPFIVNDSVSVYNSIQNSTNSLQELINLARNGIYMSFLNQLSFRLALSLQEMGDILHVSLRTLQRYAPTKKLDTDASAKVLRLAALQLHGIEVFGNESVFNKWLRKSIPALGGQVPLQLLDTPYGFEMVDNALGQIEHGVFA